MKGVDVSFHNGDIDWRAVKSAGMDFAICRTGYGKSSIDETFQRNVEDAHKAGLICGAYHYSYALTPSDAAAEAAFCKKVIADSGVLLELNYLSGLTWKTPTNGKSDTALFLPAVTSLISARLFSIILRRLIAASMRPTVGLKT